MNYILFDGTVRNALLPFTFTRPVADIRVGILTIREKWEFHLGTTTTTLTEEYLMEKYVENIEENHSCDIEIEKEKKYALVFGNEVYGVSQEAVALCDGSIEIPQLGTKHSLNISVAAGVILWEVARNSIQNKT